MKIGLVGAFDRNNFGDLLMPIVFERQYRIKNHNSDVIFNYYGQVSKNMEYLKSYNTQKLADCYNNNDIVIVVGGEVITSTYKLMYLNLQTNRFKIFFIRCLNKIFPKYVEDFSRKQLNGFENKPWILDKELLGCKKLIYNTVGGNISNEECDNERFAKVDYISLRSNSNYSKMHMINKNAKLYPDSVVTISKLFSNEEITNEVSNDIKEMTKDKYFVFQTDYRNNKNSLRKIAKQINNICNKNNINCILLPIGYAQGHDDQKALKKIYNFCKNSMVTMPKMTNIYETLYLLMHAQVFIGTSLHGIVISTSYGIPHMVLTDKIQKLIDYVETWKTTSITYTDVDNMQFNFDKIYTEEEKMKVSEYKEKLIQLAFENFANINEIIEEACHYE